MFSELNRKLLHFSRVLRGDWRWKGILCQQTSQYLFDELDFVGAVHSALARWLTYCLFFRTLHIVLRTVGRTQMNDHLEKYRNEIKWCFIQAVGTWTIRYIQSIMKHVQKNIFLLLNVTICVYTCTCTLRRAPSVYMYRLTQKDRPTLCVLKIATC